MGDGCLLSLQAITSCFLYGPPKQQMAAAKTLWNKAQTILNVLLETVTTVADPSASPLRSQ